MSESLLQTIITAIAAVLVAVVSVQGAGIKRRVKRVQAQVENDHTSNLREELDARHNETRNWLGGIWAWMSRIDTRMQAGDARMDRIEAILKQHDDDIDTLEHTLNPPKE